MTTPDLEGALGPDEDEDGPCTHCERCTWNPGSDCGQVDHVHCPTCRHCLYRHTDQERVWDVILLDLLNQHLQAAPVKLPPAVVDFTTAVMDKGRYRLRATLMNGDIVTQERSLSPE